VSNKKEGNIPAMIMMEYLKRIDNLGDPLKKVYSSIAEKNEGKQGKDRWLLPPSAAARESERFKIKRTGLEMDQLPFDWNALRKEYVPGLWGLQRSHTRSIAFAFFLKKKGVAKGKGATERRTPDES